MPLDLSHYTPLDGEVPLRELSHHPTSAEAVLVAYVAGGQRAAVWNTDTGALVWAPDGARAIAWMPDGATVAVVRDAPQPNTAAPVPGSGTTYRFDRFTWPDQQRLDGCDLVLDMGYPVDLVISPRGDLATCKWVEEGYTGLEFVQLSSAGPSQLVEASYDCSTDVMTRPVFSPGGRFLAFGAQDSVVWWAESYDAPAAGGEYEIGWVTVLDWDAAEFRDVFFDEQVPAGWHPDPQDEVVMLADPVFRDEEHLSIRLPTGTEREFDARP